MSKAGNPYLCYYLGEAANNVRKHIPEYADIYARKYAEVTKHQHKRTLALTSRKFVRLVFGLLVKNQLYIGEKLDTEYNIKSNQNLFHKILDILPECFCLVFFINSKLLVSKKFTLLRSQGIPIGS